MKYVILGLLCGAGIGWALLFAGCDQSCPAPTQSDAAVGCFPTDPCCELDSNLSPQGAPCGTGLPRAVCWEAIDAPARLRITTCSGVSAQCDGPVLEFDRDDVQCLEGYTCDGPAGMCEFSAALPE